MLLGLAFSTAGVYQEQDGGFRRGAPGAGVRRQGRSGLALRTGLPGPQLGNTARRPLQAADSRSRGEIGDCGLCARVTRLHARTQVRSGPQVPGLCPAESVGCRCSLGLLQAQKVQRDLGRKRSGVSDLGGERQKEDSGIGLP